MSPSLPPDGLLVEIVLAPYALDPDPTERLTAPVEELTETPLQPVPTARD